jgi:hypothetical protein
VTRDADGSARGTARRRRPPGGIGPAACGAALTLVFLGAPAFGGTGAPPGPDLDGAARLIQNTCFALHPADRIARMSGRTGPAPETVAAEPLEQIRFLRTEDPLEKGLYYPALLPDLLPAFRVHLAPGRTFLDLGSGDGRVVFLAAVMGTRPTGIEYDRGLHRIARTARRRLRDALPVGEARLMRGDFFDVDYGAWDILFYYAAGSYAEKRLGDRLAEEMRCDARLLVYGGLSDLFPRLRFAGSIGGVQEFRREEGCPR